MKLTIKKRNISMFWLSIYLFLAIYAPAVFPINMFHFVTLVSLLYIIVYGRRSINKIFYESGTLGFIKLIILILLIFFIGSIMSIISNDNRLNSRFQLYLFYQAIVLMFEMLICVIFICVYIFRKNMDGMMLLNCFMWAALIEFFFVAISYIFPSVRNNLLALMGSNTGLSTLYSNYNDFLSYRGYGFALELLDTFGYGTGILAGIAFIYRRKSRASYIVVACSLFATLLNSRTGLIVFAVFMVIDLFMGGKKNFTAAKIMLNIFVVVLFVFAWFIVAPVILRYIFINAKDDIIKNTVRDLIQVINLNYHTLRPEMWILPQNKLYLLFGTGHLVNEIISTVGFVNAIWSFGIVGSMLLYIFVFSLFWRTLKRVENNRIYYNIVLSLFVIFFVIQLKMPVFTYSAGGFSLFVLPFVLNYCSKHEETVNGY